MARGSRVDTAVALIMFNRPRTTERVVWEIARARPKKLFVIADGPREDRPADQEECTAARAVIERVDWNCEVVKNYSDVNLGCGHRPATGITWVFERVEEAIILEDDCIPHPTYWRFCEELLERYRDDERVMMLSGNNFLRSPRRTPYSYYFYRNIGLWGWATWRRAWQYHDMCIKMWPALRDTRWLLDILGDPRQAEYWRRIFDRAYNGGGNVDYWDYQWTFGLWAQNGLAISPSINLICNIGFGEGATHTTWVGDKKGNLPTGEMVFPLRHPPYIVRDREADELIFEEAFVPQQPRKKTRLYRRLPGKFSASIARSVGKLISSLNRFRVR